MNNCCRTGNGRVLFAAVSAQRCARLFQVVCRTISTRIHRARLIRMNPFFDGDVVARHQLFHSLAVLVDVNGWHGLNFHLVGQFAQLVAVNFNEMIVLVFARQLLEHGLKLNAVAAPFDGEDGDDASWLLIFQVELKLVG